MMSCKWYANGKRDSCSVTNIYWICLRMWTILCLFATINIAVNKFIVNYISLAAHWNRHITIMDILKCQWLFPINYHIEWKKRFTHSRFSNLIYIFMYVCCRQLESRASHFQPTSTTCSAHNSNTIFFKSYIYIVNLLNTRIYGCAL